MTVPLLVLLLYVVYARTIDVEKLMLHMIVSIPEYECILRVYLVHALS